MTDTQSEISSEDLKKEMVFWETQFEKWFKEEGIIASKEVCQRMATRVLGRAFETVEEVGLGKIMGFIKENTRK